MTDRSRGSAPVEFALVSVLVVALFLGVLQLGFALHVRTTLQAAAADGARHGAVSGRDPDAAMERTRRLIGRSLSDRFAERVQAGHERVHGVPTLVVAVDAPLPVLGPWGPSGVVRVRAHAFVEDP